MSISDVKSFETDNTQVPHCPLAA